MEQPLKSNAVAESPARRHWLPHLSLGYPDDHLPRLELPREPQRPVTVRWLLAGYLGALALAGLCGWLHGRGRAYVAGNMGAVWMLPFLVMLVSMAALPFVARRWWERFYGVVAVGLAAVVALYYALAVGHCAELYKAAGAFISFLFIIGALYIIASGMLVRLHLRATPLNNVLLLAGGALLGNIIGTTGASVLLIRPYLQMNGARARGYHVVFFIFLVSVLGGFLLPLGPPLFLAYFMGVPFWWFARHCWAEYAVTTGLVLAIFFAIDFLASRKLRRATVEDQAAGAGVPNVDAGITAHKPIAAPRRVMVLGLGNLACVGLVGVALFLPAGWREGLIATAALVALLATPPVIHHINRFHFSLLKELGILYLGIFITMAPALHLLHQTARQPVARRVLATPGANYFASGALAGILDNAPTYLAFLQIVQGRVSRHLLIAADARLHVARGVPRGGMGVRGRRVPGAARVASAYRRYFPGVVAGGHVDPGKLSVAALLTLRRYRIYFIAISLGSVFFGALTYIGNAPNYLVKGIAEKADVNCPSFLGYIWRYALPALLPVLAVVWWIFLR